MFNSTTGTAFLQKFYAPGFIDNSVAKKSSRVLGMIKREPDCGGDTYNFLSVVDDIATGSADLETAQSAASGTSTIGSQFSLTWSESNEPVRVSGKVIAQTRTRTAAWTAALKFAMDSGLRVAAHRLSVMFYTQGWGEMGQITAVSGSTFKPLVTSQIHRYLKGQKIVFSSSLNAAALRSATALTITGINYNTYLITCSGALSGPGGVDNDWVFTAGDREDSATPTRLRAAGVPVWIPKIQPVTDASISTLYGVVRSNNTRLYGQYVDGSNMSLQDGLITLAQMCTSFGNAEKLVAVVSPNNYTTLSKALGSDRRYVDVTSAGVGFKTLAIYAEGIEVPVLSDKYSDDTACWMLDTSSIVLASLGPAPHINTDDDNKILRLSTSNAVEIRIVSYTALAFKNPAACGVLYLSGSV